MVVSSIEHLLTSRTAAHEERARQSSLLIPVERPLTAAEARRKIDWRSRAAGKVHGMDGYGRRWEGWERQRSRRLRRWLVLRVGLWLVMVAIVLGLNLLIGGHWWGIGFVVVSGALLAIRIGLIWAATRRRPDHSRPGRLSRVGPRSPAG
jgi:hypothetical protein